MKAIAVKTLPPSTSVPAKAHTKNGKEELLHFRQSFQGSHEWNTDGARIPKRNVPGEAELFLLPCLIRVPSVAQGRGFFIRVIRGNRGQFLFGWGSVALGNPWSIFDTSVGG